MRLVGFLALTVIFTSVLCPAAFAANESEEVRYVRARRELQNVYERLDPRSDIIRQTRRGEYFELISAGESWFRIRIDGREGFLEAKNGKIVASQRAAYLTNLLVLIVLLGSGVGIFIYVKKQHATPVARSSSQTDDDDDDVDVDFDVDDEEEA